VFYDDLLGFYYYKHSHKGSSAHTIDNVPAVESPVRLSLAQCSKSVEKFTGLIRQVANVLSRKQLVLAEKWQFEPEI
jgi:hypothetical protein